jgi:alpha-glucosidase
MKNYKLSFILLFLAAIVSQSGMYAVNYEVNSPNGQWTIRLNVDKGTQYEIRNGETQLIAPSPIALNLNDGRVIGAGTVKSTKTNRVENTVSVLFGKNKTLIEKYNELVITYNENYNLIVRAYDEGIAYRFVTYLEGDVIINNEDAVFNFAGNPTVYFPQSPDLRNFEKTYVIYNSINDIKPDKFSVGPVLFSYAGTPCKMVITEADVYDYPGLYIEPNGSNSMRGMWANYPRVVEEPENIRSNHLPIIRYNYIAATSGSRTFPWRVFVISNDDKSLLNNELVYLLAEPQRLTDTSWIKPGKSAWEWWHKAMLEAVDFPVGYKNLGLPLYKYYIDFASKHRIEYMTLDAGWKESYIKELCDYAATKNVKIFVWTWASNALEDSTWLPRMKNQGVYGVKIDFFERNDQSAMRWGHQLAQRLADLKMVALYHGCPVPTGLNRTYPNILNFEAVRGAECNFWDSGSDPTYHVQFPLIRLLAGPADYTPGSLRNKTKEEFYPVDKPNTIPSTMGTRAHELAMYIVFDHWLAFLCDSPTEYEKYPDVLDFLANVPTTWDKTVPLDARLSEYILVAKQSGNDWYIGGMNNWEARNLEIDFSFLPPETTYTATIYRDADDANTHAGHYVVETKKIDALTRLPIQPASGGGIAIVLKKN